MKSRQSLIVNDHTSVKPRETDLPGNIVLMVGQSTKKPNNSRPVVAKASDIIQSGIFGSITVNPGDLASTSITNGQKIDIANTLSKNLAWNIQNFSATFPANSQPVINAISIGEFSTATLTLKEDVDGTGFNKPTGPMGMPKVSIEFYALDAGDEANYFQVEFNKILSVRYVPPVSSNYSSVNLINDPSIMEAFIIDIEDKSVDEIVATFNGQDNPFSKYIKAEVKYTKKIIEIDDFSKDNMLLELSETQRLQTVNKILLTSPKMSATFTRDASYTMVSTVRVINRKEDNYIDPLTDPKLNYLHKISKEKDFLGGTSNSIGLGDVSENKYYKVKINTPSDYYRDKLQPATLSMSENLAGIQEYDVFIDGDVSRLPAQLFHFDHEANVSTNPETGDRQFINSQFDVAASVIAGLGIYNPAEYVKITPGDEGVGTLTDTEYGIVFGYESVINSILTIKYVTSGISKYVTFSKDGTIPWITVPENTGSIKINIDKFTVSERITHVGIVTKLNSQGDLLLIKEIPVAYNTDITEVILDSPNPDAEALRNKVDSDVTILVQETIALGINMVPKIRFSEKGTGLTTWNQYAIVGNKVIFGKAIPVGTTLKTDLKYAHTLLRDIEYTIISEGRYEGDVVTFAFNPEATNALTDIWNVLPEVSGMGGEKAIIKFEMDLIPSTPKFMPGRWSNLHGGLENHNYTDERYLEEVYNTIYEYALEVKPTCIYICGLYLDFYKSTIDPTTGQYVNIPLNPIEIFGPLIDQLNTMFACTLYIDSTRHYLFDPFARDHRQLVNRYVRSHKFSDSSDPFNALNLRLKYNSPNIRFTAGLVYSRDVSIDAVTNKAIQYRVPSSTALMSIRGDLLTNFTVAKNAEASLRFPKSLVSEIYGDSDYQIYQDNGFEMYTYVKVDGTDKLSCISPVTGISQIDNTAQGRFWQLNDLGIKQCIIISSQYIQKYVLGVAGMTDMNIQAHLTEIKRLIKNAFGKSSFLISIDCDLTFKNDYELINGIATLTLDAVFAPTIYEVRTIASLKISKG